MRLYFRVPDEAFGLLYTDTDLKYLQVGPRTIPSDRSGAALVNFRGPQGTYSTILLSEVLDGSFQKGVFKDKIVLVGGWTADVRNRLSVPGALTPFGWMPSVEFHANALETLLNERYIRHGSFEVFCDVAWIFIFGLGLCLLLRMPSVFRGLATGSILYLTFLANVYIGFTYFDRWFNVVAPSSVLLMNWGMFLLIHFPHPAKKTVEGK